jgi:lysophospholipase L1-like esterase
LKKTAWEDSPSSLLLNLALAVGTTLVTLLLLEGGSYLFGTFEGPLHSGLGKTIQMYGQRDPLLFWSLRPYAAAPDGTRWVNSDGLRGPEIAPKQPSEFRILSLGESSTFAAQMPYEQCYSARLEQFLNAGSAETHVRVLNAGVPGYTLFQGVHFLKQRALHFRPDLVLLYFGINDFLPTAYLAKRTGERGPSLGGLNDWELFNLRQNPLTRLTSFLMAHSNFFRAMLQLVRGSDAEEIRTDTQRLRVPYEHRERLLHLALDLCRENEIQLVIVIPIYHSFEDHAELLRGFATANGLAVVDLPAGLPARFEKPRAAYFLDRAHPTPEGHLLIAEEIHAVVSPILNRAPGH